MGTASTRDFAFEGPPLSLPWHKYEDVSPLPRGASRTAGNHRTAAAGRAPDIGALVAEFARSLAGPDGSGAVLSGVWRGDRSGAL
jgi:hypothetical protein